MEVMEYMELVKKAEMTKAMKDQRVIVEFRMVFPRRNLKYLRISEYILITRLPARSLIH